MNPIVLILLGVAAWVGHGWLGTALIVVGLFALLTR